MKSRWIIGLLMTCVLAIFAGAQENGGAQPGEGTANPPAQLQPPAGLQDGRTYPEQLETVLEAMTAELGEIAQAAREGKISRPQAEYLSLERYYVALTRFQFLRTLYQDPPQGNQAESYAQANPAPQIPSVSVTLPTRTCLPDIPEQLVSYLE